MTTQEYEHYFQMLDAGKFVEAAEFRESFIPDVLTKFVYLNDEKDDEDGKKKESNEKKFYSLENNMLWFSSIDCVNDPYEFKGLYIDEQKMKEAGYSDEVISAYNEFLSMHEYSLVCLSGKDIDYLPMWAYYTNDHKGFCIEYEVIKKSAIHEVIYEPKRIPIASIFFQLKDALKQSMAHGKNALPVARKLTTILQQNLYIKSETWKHEQEYRIAFPDIKHPGENREINEFGLRVKRIIAGINCSPEHIERLNEISNKIGCGNIYTSSLSKTNYRIEINEYTKAPH